MCFCTLRWNHISVVPSLAVNKSQVVTWPLDTAIIASSSRSAYTCLLLLLRHCEIYFIISPTLTPAVCWCICFNYLFYVRKLIRYKTNYVNNSTSTACHSHILPKNGLQKTGGTFNLILKSTFRVSKSFT